MGKKRPIEMHSYCIANVNEVTDIYIGAKCEHFTSIATSIVINSIRLIVNPSSHFTLYNDTQLVFRQNKKKLKTFQLI